MGMSSEDTVLRERILTYLRSFLNSGKAPGRDVCYRKLKITEHQLNMAGFATYSEAVEEAGLNRNRFGEVKISTETLLRSLAELTKDLGRFPTMAQINVESKKKKGFPSKKTFENTLKSKADRLLALTEWIKDKAEWSDVAEILSNEPSPISNENEPESTPLEDEQDIIELSESFLPPVLGCLSEMSRGAPGPLSAIPFRALL